MPAANNLPSGWGGFPHSNEGNQDSALGEAPRSGDSNLGHVDIKSKHHTFTSPSLKAVKEILIHLRGWPMPVTPELRAETGGLCVLCQPKLQIETGVCVLQV